MLTHKKFCGSTCIQLSVAILWKFNSVPDGSNLLKLPTPILLEVSLSTMGTVFVGFHLRLRQHIIYFHWSSPFQTCLSISPFTIVFHFLLFLNFRIPITRNLIILFFLPLLSSTLPKSELCAAITTISTYDHSKVSPSKNEEKSPTAALSVTYTSQWWIPFPFAQIAVGSSEKNTQMRFSNAALSCLIFRTHSGKRNK